MLPTNTVFIKLRRRAEASERALLAGTFVDVQPLMTVLESRDHQVLFGRRGTGKTHALNVLASQCEQRGDVVAFVDLRSAGSNNGIYADGSRPLHERASGLLVDALTAVHNSILTYCLSESSVDLAASGPALDEFASSITQVRVLGEVDLQTRVDLSSRNIEKDTSSISLDKNALGAKFDEVSSRESEEFSGRSEKRKGSEILYVNFGHASASLDRVVSSLDGRRLWIVLDEWSSVIVDLQPYLADLFRRCVFPISNVTVKIAAIEHRSSGSSGILVARGSGPERRNGSKWR